MKKSILNTMLTVVAMIASFIGGMSFDAWYYNDDDLFEANEFKKELISAHEQYECGAEQLLNKLDSAYNWVDSYDLPDDYCQGVERLDSLYQTQE